MRPVKSDGAFWFLRVLYRWVALWDWSEIALTLGVLLWTLGPIVYGILVVRSACLFLQDRSGGDRSGPGPVARDGGRRQYLYDDHNDQWYVFVAHVEH